MRQKDEPEPLDPKKQDQLIYALLHCATKGEAAEAAGVHRATLYRHLADPAFRAAYQAALKDTFGDALALLSKSAVKAVQALVGQMDESKDNGSFFVIAAASRILQTAFKAQTAIQVEEELANLRTIMDAVKAGQAPAEPSFTDPPAAAIKLAADEQAEATRLRVAWMSEIGNSHEDIDQSLRYNRPTSVAEEQHLLDLVHQMMEMERAEQQALANPEGS